jgi:hypothetical protein
MQEKIIDEILAVFESCRYSLLTGDFSDGTPRGLVIRIDEMEEKLKNIKEASNV